MRSTVELWSPSLLMITSTSWLSNFLRHAELHAVICRLKGTVNVVSLCYDIYNVQVTLRALRLEKHIQFQAWAASSTVQLVRRLTWTRDCGMKYVRALSPFALKNLRETAVAYCGKLDKRIRDAIP
jgi:hypothetical protein